MKQQAIQPTGISQSFDINETFFSTTDKRGVITAGNLIFSRTSGYELSELIGQSHNIIRQPDMPRCVFDLLWSSIGRNEPFMGYVKNHAKNGNHYWVFAVVVAIPSGYLSIRIKPTSATLNRVKELYRRLLEIENEATVAGDSPQNAMKLSSATLSEALTNLGYESYEQFAFRSLQEEIEKRDAELLQKNLRLFPEYLDTTNTEDGSNLANVYQTILDAYERLGMLLENLDAFVTISDGIRERQNKVKRIAEEFRLNGINASIASDQLGSVGITIGTITQFLHEYARTLYDSVDALDQSISSTSESVAEISSRLTSARLQFEMLLNFLAEIGQKVASEKESEYLLSMAEDLRLALLETLHGAAQAVISIQGKLPKLKDDKEKIRKIIINLNVVQITGLTETSRINARDDLHRMFSGLRERIEFTQDELVFLEQIVTELTSLTEATQPKVKEVIECVTEKVFSLSPG